MPQEEDDILNQLTAQFPFLAGKVRLQRPRRLWAEVPADKLAEVFEYVVRQLGFDVYCTLTGLDMGDKLAAIYHLARANRIVLNLRVELDRQNPCLQTITGYFPAADISERELVDLLGVKVEGLPDGPRYPLPDDWPAGSYPLRKDWPGLDAPAGAAQTKPEGS
jgi:Ni,Fe-hydrogenase III component G